MLITISIVLSIYFVYLPYTKIYNMEKLISIPDDIVIALKVKAAQENTSLKKWIENQLVKMAEDKKLPTKKTIN